MLYAITDIETTGSFASGNSITEVAMILTDGVREVERWSSLVKPAGNIPRYITALTGIDHSMTENAPTFADIAEELHSLLEDAEFVAHNVHFDHSFIRKHLEMCGLRWNPRKLCTVRLSRKIIPGLPSYSGTFSPFEAVQMRNQS
jgi:DNA polymerase-3 subunit epsilon